MAPLGTIARGWGRIGLTGFGGPPAHISLLRPLAVEQLAVMTPEEFEDANAVCGLLPGPASTQLAIFCALRAGGRIGALVGGIAFIAPAVILVLALSVLFLAHSTPLAIRGAGAGAGAAVPVVALSAALSLIAPSLRRARENPREATRVRWSAYLLAGALSAALIGPYLVLVLLACGAIELGLSRRPALPAAAFALVGHPLRVGGWGALAWTALKVGGLAFGGGFVIVPLMQSDAVHVYHWMTNAHFLDAVALGQVTPGPVVATVAAVGYAAHGIVGGMVAALIAFAPSFSFVLLGGPHFERVRGRPGPRAFLGGAGPAAIGAILGSAYTLAAALAESWQFVLLVLGLLAMFAARRGVVATIVAAGAAGAALALLGAPVPG